MNLQDIYKELNLTPEQLQELSDTVKTNPMAAMGLIQKFKISPEVIQKIIGMMMSDPGAFQKMAEQAGVSRDMVDQVRKNLETPGPGSQGSKD